MNEPLQIAGWPEIDHPWQRLLWVVPISLLLWMLLLLGFSALVNRHRQAAAAAQITPPLEAELVYMPPAAGSPHAAPAAAPPKPAVVHPAPPKPVHHVRHVYHHVVPRSPLAIPRPAAKAPPPEAPAAPRTAGKSAPASSAAAPAHGTPGAGAAGGSGPGLKGFGGASMGARATYAPLPEIPDDLREDGFEGVAVAHFKVDRDGNASVTLSQATSDASLNGLLLATLKRWRFMPAIKDGVPVDSVFDIRIPIQVQ